jgi:hypothetical protein
MTRRIRTLVVTAYIFTWIGGWYAHRCEMTTLAERLYVGAESRNRQLIEWEQEFREKTPPIQLRVGGAKSVVKNASSGRTR